MNKKTQLIYSALIVIVLFGIYLTLNSSEINFNQDNSIPKVAPIACTMEAKICPDGSYVGRSGPKCEFAKCPESTSSADNWVAFGDSIKISGVKITPINILNDSRCPSGVQCVWAGTVSLLANISSDNNKKDVEFELGKPITFGKYTITLDKLSPEKKSSEIISSEYVFYFTVK